MKIERTTIQLIHIAKSDLCMTDDVYRAMLYEYYKVKSSKDMTEEQGLQLLVALEQRGWVRKIRTKPSGQKRKASKSAPLLMSATQAATLKKLRARIVWIHSDGYERFVLKCLGRKFPRTFKEAGLLIRKLEIEIKNQQRTQEAVAR